MSNFVSVMKDFTVLQRVIFIGALYSTAPLELPKAQLEEMEDDLINLQTYLSVSETAKANRAMRILIQDYNFPSTPENVVIRFLQQF